VFTRSEVFFVAQKERKSRKFFPRAERFYSRAEGVFSRRAAENAEAAQRIHYWSRRELLGEYSDKLSRLHSADNTQKNSEDSIQRIKHKLCETSAFSAALRDNKKTLSGNSYRLCAGTRNSDEYSS